MKEKFDKFTKERLLEVCDILDIPISKATTKKVCQLGSASAICMIFLVDCVLLLIITSGFLKLEGPSTRDAAMSVLSSSSSFILLLVTTFGSFNVKGVFCCKYTLILLSLP